MALASQLKSFHVVSFFPGMGFKYIAALHPQLTFRRSSVKDSSLLARYR